MTTWKNIICNSNLVQKETDRSFLIKLPKSELKFWHPAKLCRTSGKNGYRLSIGYTDDFNFKCFRTGNGKHNFKDIIEEVEYTASQIEELFGVNEDASESED